MRNTWKFIFVVMLTSFAVACGSASKEKKDDLAGKKSELEKLKGEKSKLDDQIRVLEDEIAKLDTTAAASHGKLVAITTVAEQPFEHFIDLQGRVDADNISVVTPRGGPGQVKSIFIKKGDIVHKGQVLLKLDDAVTLKQLQTLKTQLAYAEDILRRQKNLWEQGIGTEVQLKTAENSVNSLRDQINTLTAGWEMTNVTSDVDGYVEQLNLKPGETFVGMAGTVPQIQIVNTSSLKIVTELPENYIGRVKKGTPVKISLPDVGMDLTSNISLMNQSIGLNSRSVTTEARIPYNSNIHVNQVAVVRIKDYENPKAMVVPLAALQTDEKGKFVYVVVTEGGKKLARKKNIQVGEIYGNEIEVKGGLATGDQVVTEGIQSLYEGQLVTTK